AAFEIFHVDRKDRTRVSEAPIEGLLHRVEWRYMELLAEAKMLLIAAREVRSRVEYVGVLLVPWRVVHFGDNGGNAAVVCIANEVETDRIEAVPEVTQMGQQP